MMKLFGITNISAFMSCIRECTGEVEFRDKNGEMRDLKALAQQLEVIEDSFTAARLDELTICAKSPEDQCRLLNYAAEMALAS